MTALSSDLDLQQLWQARPEALAPITLQDIHARALAFRRQALRRRILSWSFIALAVVGLWFAKDFTGWMMQSGTVLTLAAAIFVLWRWQAINSLGPAPDGAEALAQAYRSSLIRLRDARRTVLIWRIAPILPGLTLVFLGRWFQLHARGLPLPVDRWVVVLTLAVAAIGLCLGWLRHRREADKLQRRIDEFDRMQGR